MSRPRNRCSPSLVVPRARSDASISRTACSRISANTVRKKTISHTEKVPLNVRMITSWQVNTPTPMETRPAANHGARGSGPDTRQLSVSARRREVSRRPRGCRSRARTLRRVGGAWPWCRSRSRSCLRGADAWPGLQWTSEGSKAANRPPRDSAHVHALLVR